MRPRPIHGELPQSLFRIYGVPRYWTVYSLGEDWKPEPFYIGCSSNHAYPVITHDH